MRKLNRKGPRLLMGMFVCMLMLPTLGWTVGVGEQAEYTTREKASRSGVVPERVSIVPKPVDVPLNVRVRTDRARYHIGDSIRVHFSVTRDAYVFIFNTDAAGITRQIFPNYYDRQNFCKAGREYYIPDRSYDLEVTGPPGNETLTIVAVAQDLPILREFHRYSRRDPYPASRDGAAALVRRIEQLRAEPSSLSIRPVPRRERENLWAEDTTTFYVMGVSRVPPPTYKVPRYGQIEVDSVPDQARIYLDGEYYGRTPQTIERVEMGYHRIRIEKEGYQPYDTHVYVQPNVTKHLDIFLKKTEPRPAPRWKGLSIFCPSND
ncbi:MAG: hypothetical protein KatS3mg130_1769 [Candidatus Sumerlaea sp.]|nr:MAG: hypothetical protein KatS3mg130_1769 [Candidatus Sumerlaea sp.]